MNDDAPILIDVTRLIWRRWANRRPTGIDRVCLAYLDHFAPRAQAVVQSPGFRRILTCQASNALFELLLREEGNFRPKLMQYMLRHVFSAIQQIPGRERLYLNIGHTGLDQPGFVDWTKAAHVRPVYMVHDLIPITHPAFCRAGELTKHRLRIQTMLETGWGIIGNSQATLEVLNTFARAESLPMLPQVSSWLGGTPFKVPRGANRAPKRPYFVMLGTIEGRKNHLLILNIWIELIHELGTSAPQLRIIGQRGWEASQVLAMLDRISMLQGHVLEINDCSDAELAEHLLHARALLFPSMAEGYGLPIVEALGAGLPVIASDIPVFREIAGNVPEYLSPIDGSGWKNMILDYAGADSSKRTTQITRLSTYRIPDWKEHFRKIDSWIN